MKTAFLLQRHNEAVDHHSVHTVHDIVTFLSCVFKKSPPASPAGNWTRPLGRPRITWMKTIQQDLKSSDLNMDDAVDLAQNRPLWRLMSTFSATHS